MQIDLDEHIGKKLLALNIGVGCSPALKVAVSPDLDIDEVLLQLNTKIGQLLLKTFGRVFYSLDDTDMFVKLAYEPEIILSAKEREAKYKKSFAEIGKIFREEQFKLDEESKHNPDNGKYGFWFVDGMRHHTIVRASSAPDAIAKAITSEKVGSWESPEASFIGEALPVKDCADEMKEDN